MSRSFAASIAVHLLGVAFAFLAGCREETPPRAPTAEAEDSPAARTALAGDDPSALEELAAVGYVDAAPPAPEADPGGGTGVVLHEEELASPGYNLVTILTEGGATLVDMRGRSLRSWSDRRARDARWSRAVLLENGDLLGLSTRDDMLLCFRWTGELRWRIPLKVHHDADDTPDGSLLVLTQRIRDLPELDTRHRSVDNLLTLVSLEGKVLEEVSLYDAIRASPEVLTIQAPPGTDKLPAGPIIDPIHANSAKWMRRAELAERSALFGPDKVLVTLRYPDSIAILDWESKKLVWAWGAGVLEGPHEATVLLNGHVLVFDNGNGYEERGFSRVIEMDPLTGEIVWEYRAPNPGDFYSEGRGTAQGLPNGNVLIANSNQGEAFEVTREGRIVWRYLSPALDAQGNRGVIRIRRYPPEFVERFVDAEQKE